MFKPPYLPSLFVLLLGPIYPNHDSTTEPKLDPAGDLYEVTYHLIYLRNDCRYASSREERQSIMFSARKEVTSRPWLRDLLPELVEDYWWRTTGPSPSSHGSGSHSCPPCPVGGSADSSPFSAAGPANFMSCSVGGSADTCSPGAPVNTVSYSVGHPADLCSCSAVGPADTSPCSIGNTCHADSGSCTVRGLAISCSQCSQSQFTCSGDPADSLPPSCLSLCPAS